MLVLLAAEDDGHLEVRDDDGVEERRMGGGHEDGAVLLGGLLACRAKPEVKLLPKLFLGSKKFHRSENSPKLLKAFRPHQNLT